MIKLLLLTSALLYIAVFAMIVVPTTHEFVGATVAKNFLNLSNFRNATRFKT
jgi:hypothetical protein